MQQDKLMKYLKLISIFFLLINSNNISYSKPVPPGAGDGDVAANILFLVDSSASMQSWIGTDGLGAAPKAVYDSNGNILINQSGRRAVGIVRYTSAGKRDTDFTPIRVTPAAGCTNVYDSTRSTVSRNVRRNRGLRFIEGFSGQNITNKNMFFFNSLERHDRDMVFGFTEDGSECLFALRAESQRARVHDIDIKQIGGTYYMFMGGPWRRGGFFKVCNLSTMACTNQEFRGRNTLRTIGRLSVNNEGTMVYMTDYRDGNVRGFNLDLTSATPLASITTPNRICTKVNNPDLSNDVMHATTVAVSPDDSDILYIGSHINHAIQKLEFTSETDCVVRASIGSGANSVISNKGTSGDTAADDVRFSRVWGIHVDAERNRILTATTRGYVDEFNETAFNVDNRDTSWLQQMGGPRVRRWDGVKDAMNAIVNDTTLTTGAHFGFGHWNAGRSGGGKNSTNGGAHCHRNDTCTYYDSWKGEHPAGTSELCNSDSCLNVGISSKGASQIMKVLEPMGLAWGTDSNAFADLASKYFNDADAGGQVFDPDSQCQLNYVIVIGDGAMMNSGFTHRNFRNQNTTTTQKGVAGKTISDLRQKGVKTLMVAYGGGIRPGAMDLFDRFAEAGSCATAGSDECEPTIVANTPEELKSELTSKIRQIIADKLAFTAPSITATIQEGGSLYQAQFAYEQFGEWKGTILRKKLNSDGTVEHTTTEPNAHGNWSAAVKVKGQSRAGDAEDERHLWSAIPGASYFGNWDNFKVANSSIIASDLFDMLGYTVPDYHNASSYCATRETGAKHIGSNGNADDIEGLIKFMKGNDYFDYDGDCNVEEIRKHVMGDIYHSQLIEVGPPDASLDFSNRNEEAYHRSTNNYQGFMSKHSQRRNIIYAGSNSGVLHAINSVTGEEEWGFIPPFIAALLPQLINKGYDGNIDAVISYVLDDEGKPKLDAEGNPIAITAPAGGTNPVFGVDGSPVVHDALIEGYDALGNETGKQWRTILFVPYGRGGAGFSVLDITNPIIADSSGPIHMFSIFNDQINKKILIADFEGNITEEPYNSGFSSFLQSEEGIKASSNYMAARADDDEDCNSNDGDDTNDCTKQDEIAACVDSDTLTDADPPYRDEGTSSCYTSDTFHFANITIDVDDNTKIDDGVLSAKQLDNITGLMTTLGIADARMSGGLLKVQFDQKLTINANRITHVTGADKETNQFSISTSCKGATGIPVEYDYTQLGETWSTPRIVRIPSVDGGGINEDRYVAIMGGGMSKNDTCAGSAVFLVDLHLDERDKPGRIYAAVENKGPITIVDTTPDGIMVGGTKTATENGSDIVNAIPAAPVVITPDTAFGIPWRGALVYINDLEGKITKINLTNSTRNSAALFDQTTLFRLDANTDNARYSYFAMDAGIGMSTNQLMLFGATGNFTDLGGREPNMDNIMYGITDPDYPYFKHLNISGGKVPRGDNTTFFELAHKSADAAAGIDNAAHCKNVTGATDFSKCIEGKQAWVIKLGQDASNNFYVPKTFRKASASPTLFKGQVYFPIYQPPDSGVDRCAQGSAFICVSDDECGYNNSARLRLPAAPADVNNPGANACAFVRKGILSELVIFADKLFANVAGPTGDEDTLFSILSIPGEIMQNKGGWRDSSF